MKSFTLSLTATPDAIDELGHVNNAVWVQWIQQVATGHWDAAAPQSHRDAYIWVVVRHEIDYLRALGPGETVTARTWVADKPQGRSSTASWNSPARAARAMCGGGRGDRKRARRESKHQ